MLISHMIHMYLFFCVYCILYTHNSACQKKMILHDSQSKADQTGNYPHWLYYHGCFICTQISSCPKCCSAVSAGYDEPGTPLAIWPFVPSRWWPLDLMELTIPELLAKSVDVRHDVNVALEPQSFIGWATPGNTSFGWIWCNEGFIGFGGNSTHQKENKCWFWFDSTTYILYIYIWKPTSRHLFLFDNVRNES